MQIDSYEREGQIIYAGLAKVVESILHAALSRSDGLRVQQIQSRAKAVESLKHKLASRQAPEGSEIEDHAKDLAGARVIFYNNSDVSRFQRSDILSDNFEIDWHRTKIHHPTTQHPAANELFISNNYVVRLKSDRAALPEYAKYAGLWCEVQVQTTLNHAWAEMAHDTIYKRHNISGFGTNLMAGIDDRMNGIMRDYLAPAGYAFQKVLSDFDRLSKGKVLFEQGVVAAISEATNKNELYEALENISNSVLPHCDQADMVSGILPAIASSLERLRSVPAHDRETPFGTIPGKTGNDVARAAASIIRHLWYVDIDETFTVLCQLFKTATEGDEAQIWVGLVGDLAKPDLTVWKEAGSIVQAVLTKRVVALSEPDQQVLRPVILAVLKQVFATEITGVTAEFETMTIRRGTVPGSDALAAMRQEALDLLFALDASSPDQAAREVLLEVYSAAMAMPPFQGARDSLLINVILLNSASIIKHFARQQGFWPYERRQKIEHELLWMHRHNGDGMVEGTIVEALQRAQRLMSDAIQDFRTAVNADEGYKTYKLLVGFESVFPPAWDDKDFGYEAEQRYRQEQIGPIIAAINVQNADEWLAIIRRCAATKSDDLATFPMFCEFLEKLAAAHPELVARYLSRIDETLVRFIAPMLRGLKETASWAETELLLHQWMAEGRFLSDIVFAIGAVDALPMELLSKAVDAAEAISEDRAVFGCISTIARRDGPETAEFLKNVLLRVVAYATAKEEPRWVFSWLPTTSPSPTIALLSVTEAEAILDSLVGCPKLVYVFERFLGEIAQRNADLVLRFFGKRLAKCSREGWKRDYDAVPHRLEGSLRTALAANPEALLAVAHEWFQQDQRAFELFGGQLVAAVFPEYAPELEAALRVYVDDGNTDGVSFVVTVMRSYKGQRFLDPLAKELVARLPEGHELLGSVEIALEQTGVLHGEFGRVEHLRAHQARVAEWREDPRESVRSFADQYVRQLANVISAEQRRSEERLALGRLEYGPAAARESE